MTQQYEHMTLTVEGDKIVAVNKPQVPNRSLKDQILGGIFEPLPGALVNQTVAFALNQLSAQKWEVTRMPSTDERQRETTTRPYSLPGLESLPNILNVNIPEPLPNTPEGRYHIELRRAIGK